MFEMIVAMNVIDDKMYAQYREAMMPILESYGGGFRHDFVVSEVLKTEVAHPVTRLFTLYFPSEEARAALFADATYQQVKEKYFNDSVDGFTVIATHHI